MTKYRAWYEKVYRNSKFDRKNMERSETSTTVWPCSKTEPVSPLSVCGDYLEHFRGILDVQEYNINTIQINIGFGWIWCTGYLSKNVLCQTCSTTVSVESENDAILWDIGFCLDFSDRDFPILPWIWICSLLFLSHLLSVFFLYFSDPCMSLLSFSFLFLSLLVFSVLFPFLVFTLVIFIFLFFRVLFWSSLYLVLVLSSFPLRVFAFVVFIFMFFSSWLSCSLLPFLFYSFPFLFFPFSVFNIAPLILVCANFKLRKSKVSQPNFHCTLIYFCIKHFWGVSKHMVFDLVFTFSNIFWHFFDISTRGFLSGPGSYQPFLRGNDRVGQINDSSTDVQFKLYKLFNGKKYGILHEF